MAIKHAFACLALLLGASAPFGVGPAAAADPAAPPQPPPPAPVVRTAHTPAQEQAALRPVLIGKRSLEQARKRLELQLSRTSRETEASGLSMEEGELVVADFSDDVQIIYSLEFPEGAQLVSAGMMRAWGMDLERLHRRSLANLDAALSDFRVKPVARLPWLYVIDADDGYAASRVLLRWRWAELAAKQGGVLILGMPSRDVVVFTATEEPEKLQQLRETVETVEQHQGRPVSSRLWRWTARGWQPSD